MNTITIPMHAILAFRPPRTWLIARPDGTYWIVWPRDLDRLARKAKARRTSTASKGGNGNGAA